MKTNFSRIILSILFAIAVSANAEEVNFGKRAPSVDDVIQQFKVDQSESDSDEYQVSTGKTRGLKRIDMGRAEGKPRGHFPEKKSADRERAISLEVLFEYNSAELTEQAKAQLLTVGKALSSTELQGLHYRVEGHTDVVGGEQFNLDLSLKRAEVVRQFLADQSGLVPELIAIEGKGKQQLADPLHPTSEVNRRVRIVRVVN